MSGEMTDARREAMGWRLVQGLIGPTWVHASYGLRRWSVDVPDIIVPLQEENARLKAELAELRKPEAPTEWAAGQVWRYEGGDAFVVLTYLGEKPRCFAMFNIGPNTGRLRSPDFEGGELDSDPSGYEDLIYQGMYADLYPEAE